MGKNGLLGAILEPLFGGPPDPPRPQPLPPIPDPPKDPREMTPEEREAEKKRRAQARKAARNPNLLTGGIELGEPETRKKTLLGG